MSVMKSQIKAEMAKGFGQDLEKDLENAQVKVYKLQGAHDALGQAAVIISDMSTKVRDDLYQGVISFDPEDPLAVAKFVAAQIQAVVGRLKEFAETAKFGAIKADGERAGLELAVGKMKSAFDSECAKLSSFMEKVESGDTVLEDGEEVNRGEHRPIGMHPGPTLKMQRQEDIQADSPKKRGRKKQKGASS